MIRRPPRSPLFPSTTLFRSAQADVRFPPAEARRPHVVARVGGDECDGRGERAGPEYAVCIRTVPVPERPAALQPRPRPFEPPGDRRVYEAGLPSLLAPLPNPLACGAAISPHAVDE